ncbi:hypothetical protein LAZ67_11000496 [Cordylochernes scorpioides]|uniref:Uncharacterized protein n=1 Tax=Cordylochernes scorpioides TaxID=51811 RepID=A0ABY6KYM7_9ARAC|nr:hypothetical protein LAZ67_11000496 [Cordylochernes scorpioides]
MRALAKELQVDEATIRRVVHEDLRYKSYMMWRGHFMSERIMINHMTKAKRLLNKLKHPEEPGTRKTFLWTRILEDKPRMGRPRVTDIETLRYLVMDNPQQSTCEISARLGPFKITINLTLPNLHFVSNAQDKIPTT